MRKNIQPQPAPTASIVGPCPTKCIIQISRTSGIESYPAMSPDPTTLECPEEKPLICVVLRPTTQGLCTAGLAGVELAKKALNIRPPIFDFNAFTYRLNSIGEVKKASWR